MKTVAGGSQGTGTGAIPISSSTLASYGPCISGIMKHLRGGVTPVRETMMMHDDGGH
jgi:hypothetical protein